MGGNFWTSDESHSFDKLYCETCGDADNLVDRGEYGELIKEYAKKVINQLNSLKSVGTYILDSLSLDEVMELITKQEDYEDEECKDIERCSISRKAPLYEILNDTTIPYVCRKCILDNRLVDLLY